MSTFIALAVLVGLFALLVQLTRHDQFTGPRPHDRFRDADGFLFRNFGQLR